MDENLHGCYYRPSATLQTSYSSIILMYNSQVRTDILILARTLILSLHSCISKTTIALSQFCSQQTLALRTYIYVEIKCQLDATEVFIANLIACSTCFVHYHAHYQELKSIIQWLLLVVFCAVVFQVAGPVWS